MRLALVVSGSTRDGVADTPALLAAAAQAEVAVRLLDWRAEQDWGWADAVLLHAPWDYTQHLAAFERWLSDLSERQAVFNPWSRIAWNTHKGYLLTLADAGVPVPLTRVLRAHQPVGGSQLLETFGGSAVVVKPAVGSGGRRLHRLDTVEALASTSLVDEAGVPQEDLLVQQFVPSVEELGEHSLVLVGGAPTHLVRKVPAQGQYRVQARFGGRSERVPIDGAARRLLERVRPHVEGLAYARVDYVLDESGGPLLMELEVTEPDLFLEQAPEAAAALVQHLVQRTSGS